MARIIYATPIWEGFMPALIAAVENGTAKGQDRAIAELMRLEGEPMTARQTETGKRGRRPPHRAAPITDQDRDEAAAIAGAKAEARGLPLQANPYRQTLDLRRAWASGWTISRKDRTRQRIT